MKSDGLQRYIRDTLGRTSGDGGALAIIVLLLAYLFLFPSLSSNTFSPNDKANNLDVSALRANIHLAARNEGRHLRDADRDDGKGGPPPNNSPYILVALSNTTAPQVSEHKHLRFQTPHTRSLLRGRHQPRAPPLSHS